MRANKSVMRVFTGLIFLAVLVLAFGYVRFYTQGFTTGFATFYLEHNSVAIMGNVSKQEYKSGAPLRFDCKYTFSVLNKSLKGYTVKVLPNEGDFDFFLEGEEYPYLFSAELDLTAGVDIVMQEDYFLLSLPKSLEALLEKVHGKKVTIEGELEEVDYLKLVVTATTGETTIEIGFRIYLSVDSLTSATSLVV